MLISQDRKKTVIFDQSDTFDTLSSFLIKKIPPRKIQDGQKKTSPIFEPLTAEPFNQSK